MTPKTDTLTLINAMRRLADDIHSDDGVANAAIEEAADRLTELERENAALRELTSTLGAPNHINIPVEKWHELRVDKERLDWLDQKIVSSWLDGKDFVVWDKSSPQPCSIREWIDAARKEAQL